MAPTKPPAPDLLPPSSSERNNSPELGSPSKTTQYNKKTGRPVRRSAGKVRRVAGYVDSTLIESDDEAAFDSLTTDESETEMTTPARNRRARQRRKRSPSPPSPSLQPIIYNQEPDDLTDDEASGAFHHNSPKKPPVTLQFNVPLGFHGPLFVKLDSKLLKNNDEGVQHDMQPAKKKARTSSPVREQAVAVVSTTNSKGFNDLPPELRNKIYRALFVRRQALTIPQRSQMGGLCLSGQFLRTCKTVHDEGCSVLYGENEFHFERHNDTRAPFWDATPKEIGYQDFLHFLKKIGPENIQYLREIEMSFDDAMPKFSPNLTSDTRRFVVDGYLLSCLRMLRDAKLRKIDMKFFGRRQIFKSDVRFLGYLEQIKADEVSNITPSYFREKLPMYLWNDLKEQMVRKKKLYERK